jgi:hypothetical protein
MKWKRRIVGFAEILDEFEGNSGTTDLETTKDRLIELFKADPAYESDQQFTELVEEFEIFTADEGESYFNRLIEALYDWADAARVWIEPQLGAFVRKGDRFRSTRSKSGRVWEVDRTEAVGEGVWCYLWPDPNTGARTAVGTAGGVKSIRRTQADLQDAGLWERVA